MTGVCRLSGGRGSKGLDGVGRGFARAAAPDQNGRGAPPAERRGGAARSETGERREQAEDKGKEEEREHEGGKEEEEEEEEARARMRRASVRISKDENQVKVLLSETRRYCTVQYRVQ